MKQISSFNDGKDKLTIGQNKLRKFSWEELKQTAWDDSSKGILLAIRGNV